MSDTHNPENKGREPLLDTTAHFGSRSDQTKSQADRSARYRQMVWAAPYVSEYAGLDRMWNCRDAAQSKVAGVDTVTSRYGDGPERAHYEGVQTCGYVKYCPCCARRIAETRRAEMNQLIAWARARGYTVQMMTLTARHGAGDRLDDLVTGIKAAKRALHRHRAWGRTKPQLVGYVTAFEITGGGPHGWHPHFHVVIITREPVDLDQLRDPWIASLRGQGLDGTGAGWKVQDASSAGRYIAKWGIGEEVALTDRKKAVRGGATPFELLASASDGDTRAKGLWIEYLRASPQINVLRWSRGLKSLAEIGEVSDEDAAQDQAQEEQVETGRANIPHHPWKTRVARRGGDRRAALLDRAEEIGAEAAVAELLDAAPDHDDIAELLYEMDVAPVMIAGGLRERLAASIAAREPPGRGPSYA